MQLPKCANLPLAKLHVQFLSSDVFSIEKACDEISNSVRLRKLFGIVLNIGNRLNTAGPGQKRKAGAFSIKSLLKLNQAQKFKNFSEIFFPYNVDFRGRAYPVPPHFSIVGSDLCRGLLVFAHPKKLGRNGLYWLKVHLANLAG